MVFLLAGFSLAGFFLAGLGFPDLEHKHKLLWCADLGDCAAVAHY